MRGVTPQREALSYPISIPAERQPGARSAQGRHAILRTAPCATPCAWRTSRPNPRPQSGPDRRRPAHRLELVSRMRPDHRGEGPGLGGSTIPIFARGPFLLGSGGSATRCCATRSPQELEVAPCRASTPRPPFHAYQASGSKIATKPSKTTPLCLVKQMSAQCSSSVG